MGKISHQEKGLLSAETGAIPDMTPAILTAREIRERRGRIRFRVYENMLKQHDLSELDLSVRAENCLHRAGLQTAGDLAQSIDRLEDLLKYRNLGVKSAQEIMYKLFLFQYAVLPAERRPGYLEDVVQLNR